MAATGIKENIAENVYFLIDEQESCVFLEPDWNSDIV